ncbi:MULTISPECIES: SUKH-4 family immunity protein [Streptomyces]|uniref:SUKH-4 family immunity protein n=1 Tax=Streptomyces siderophoricus TaxID=2802281 RepID=A0ABS1N0J1_9ACTN|nr:SUKH-4 family immunity protein [Streptomyces sp. 9-7]MBL1093572.1 SUKH-4 family immunity protein [Streptomyces sp. 9-7]
MSIGEQNVESPPTTLAELEVWLDEPRQQGGVVVLRGATNSHAGPVLEALRRRVPGAVFVDCLHLTAVEVAVRVLIGLGVAPEDAHKRRPSLWDAQGLISRDAVVLLANAQWAGPTTTSTEPERVLRGVAERLGEDNRRRLRIVVEGDSDRLRIPPRRHLPEVLVGGGAGTDGTITRQDAPPVARERAVQILAAAETSKVSLSAWAALCNALDFPTTEGDLQSLIAQYREHLSVHPGTEGDEANAECVAFTSQATRWAARAAASLSASDHQRLFRLLASPDRPSVLTRYAAQTAPLHAAHGGIIEELLSNGEMLAGVERDGLLQGIAAAWPNGVPQGALATDIHYLETQRVDPVSHGEWVSWLHWAAVNRGQQDVAEGLVRANAGMPWRTLWSRQRPYGVFGPVEGEVGRVDQVRVQHRSGAPVAVMRRVVQYDDMGGPLNEQYVERSFTLDDGVEVDAEAVVQIPYNQEPPELPEFQDDAALPPPRTPGNYRAIKPAGPGRWVVGGQGGLYTLDVAAVTDPATGRWSGGPLLGPLTKSATWRCPEEALDDGAPSRPWLEKTFGSESCRTLPEHQLPDGLHPSAREFLTVVGIPHLTGQIPFFSTLALDEEGLQEFEWPEDGPEPEREGPFYRIGSWMGGAVVLDGPSGSILQDTESGYSSVLLASSLQQFFILLRLYCEYRTSWLPTVAEALDARWSLREWAEEIDPATETGDHWDEVFEGDLDDLGSY